MWASCATQGAIRQHQHEAGELHIRLCFSIVRAAPGCGSKGACCGAAPGAGQEGGQALWAHYLMWTREG